MLCLQWEPDIIAVALMYLASRLTKVEVSDWHGKIPGQKIKWYEALVEDATLEILEGKSTVIFTCFVPFFHVFVTVTFRNFVI